MEKSAFLYAGLGIALFMMASFAFDTATLTSNAIVHNPGAETSDFQVILAIGGLIAIIVGIIKS